MPDISELTEALSNEFQLTAHMAAELECYVALADTSPETMDSFWRPVSASLTRDGLPILRIEKERGHHQYEIITGVTDPLTLAHTLQSIRAAIEKQAKWNGIDVSFAGKPWPDQPSSGLHMHLHLADVSGVNVFHKTEEWTSDLLRFSIGGLLATLNDHLPVFFPQAEDYARLDDPDHVPKIAGWGVNNRYCALRIPADPDPYHKRIEHRVPCANADPAAVISAVLVGVLNGLRARLEPPAQSYGKRVSA